MLFNNRNFTTHIFCFLLCIFNTAFADEVYVLNYRNLFIKIAEEIPSKYAGVVEVVKPDNKLDCSRSRYALVYRGQKSQYAEIVKEMEKYIKNQKISFAEKCTTKYILDILRTAQKYIGELLDIKARWAECTITNEQANKQFETMWNNLFYTFNNKQRPKKVYEKEERMPDLPTDDENHFCVRNAPYLFCEIVHYFLFRFFIVRGEEEKTFYRLKKKVDFSKSMSDVITRWQESLKDICVEPEKIDYMQELDKEPEFDKIIEEEAQTEKR